MPEGDTVWLAAQRMNTALAGATLRRGEFRHPPAGRRRPDRRHGPRGRPPRQAPADPAGRRPDAAHPLPDGRQLAHLPARARSGTAARPTTSALVLATDEWECVGYRLHDIELVPTAEEDRLVGHLGPDVLGPDWDLDEALRRLRAHPDEQIGVAILDQRNLAGIGNLYKVESLFLRGVHPWARVADVADLRGPGRARPHADAGQPAPPRAEHHRRSPPRPGPLGLRPRRASPAGAAAPPILLGEQGPPTAGAGHLVVPDAARRPAPRSTRRPAPASPDRPQPVTLY